MAKDDILNEEMKIPQGFTSYSNVLIIENHGAVRVYIRIEKESFFLFKCYHYDRKRAHNTISQ